MKQNITLSLDKELLQRLRVIAAQRSTSVTRLLSDELEAILERSEQYDQARRYALTSLDGGFHLGGKYASRDDLHER